jgi:pyridoxal phosphate enzyme (YggS family)
MNYLELKRNISQLALQHGRDPKEITLLVVSKTHTWDEVAPLYDAGCRDFGESRVQEALEKMNQAPKDIKWHFIGTLQKNKVAKVIGKFALIHSIDTLDLAQKISELSVQHELITPILLQVNISGEETKHGMTIDSLRHQFSHFNNLPGLKIEGLMTMAPLTDNQETIRRCFSSLRALKEELGLTHLSMGMTHDYPLAIAEGATLLRIGTLLFGER